MSPAAGRSPKKEREFVDMKGSYNDQVSPSISGFRSVAMSQVFNHGENRKTEKLGRNVKRT